MTYTKQDVFNELGKAKAYVLNKGGTIEMPTGAKQPPLTNLVAGIQTIPINIIQGTNYSVLTAETQNTTFTISQNGQIIDTKTNDSTVGGVVIFTPSSAGTYTLTATQNGTQKWTKEFTIATVGEMIVKTPIALNDYSEDEINLAAKNHYAKYMWNVFDWKDSESFMGNTTTEYKRRYILGFETKELADGSGMCGIEWIFTHTPGQYNYDDGSQNGVSWEGSKARTRCLPTGIDYYRYDNTVTAGTAGTYYTYDYTLNTWLEHTLPDEYMDTADYYAKMTTTQDGVIWNGVPTSLRNTIVSVKIPTWRGFVKANGSPRTAKERAAENANIISIDKLYLPCGQDLFGDRPDRYEFNYYGYNKNEGMKLPMPNNYWTVYGSNSYFLRSPNCSLMNEICYWYISELNVYNQYLYTTYQFAVSFCQ